MNALDFPRPVREAQMAVEGSFARVAAATFVGYAFDPAEPSRRFTVELLVDGEVVATARADAPAENATVGTMGDGCCGFSFSLSERLIEPGVVIEARLANVGTLLGRAITIGPDEPAAEPPTGPGELRWLGGLRFSAWVADVDPIYDVLVDGAVIMEARATGWTSRPAGAARTLAFHLPERFADGAVHRASVRNARGEMLAGAYQPFVAFANGLASAVATLPGREAERLPAEMFDQMFPVSWPLTRYPEWRERLPVMRSTHTRAAVVIVGRGRADDTRATLEGQADADWVAAALPPTDDALGYEPDDALRFLAGEAADLPFVIFAAAGTRLLPHALSQLAGGFTQDPRAIAVYGDLEFQAADGACWPLFFPAFDYERMLEQGYCALLFALPRARAERALSAGASNLFRLFNAQLDEDTATTAFRIVHVPGALATLSAFDTAAAGRSLAPAGTEHLHQRGTIAAVSANIGQAPFATVHIRRPPVADVALIIATDGKAGVLGSCLCAIAPAAKAFGADIVLIDTRHGHDATMASLAEASAPEATIVTIDGPFNPARMANLGARSTDSRHLCFIADDITSVADDWLDELLARLADPTVGAASAVAVGTDGLVRDAGVVLGPRFATAAAFADSVAGEPGYGGLLTVAHERSALDTSCMVVRRRDYAAVGGMDETWFPLVHGSVDLCLKLRAAGHHLIVTPHARVVRADAPRPIAAARQERELRRLRAKWGEALADDPTYSPLLGLDGPPYTSLAWPPRDAQPRRMTLPVPRPIPVGF